jgi:hypothetical protein
VVSFPGDVCNPESLTPLLLEAATCSIWQQRQT